MNQFAQHFTPYTIAEHMANLFKSKQVGRLLEPSYGTGTLLKAAQKVLGGFAWDAYELDTELSAPNVTSGDFLLAQIDKRYTHVIMNPPYQKINAKYKPLGYDMGNTYSAFVHKCLTLLEPNGELVALIPRSFCNGVTFKALREYIKEHCSIDYILLFDSRKSLFKGVMQEVVIIKISKRKQAEYLTVAHCDDIDLSKIQSFQAKHLDIAENIITIPKKLVDKSKLTTLKMDVSNGSIDMFTSKGAITPGDDLYCINPLHLKGNELVPSSKHPLLIQSNERIAKRSYPAGRYILIKRTASKDEPKIMKVYAIEFDKDVCFDNHLQVIHNNRQPLDEVTFKGLYVWLRSSFIEQELRSITGSIHVNILDIKSLPYPDEQTIKQLSNYFSATMSDKDADAAISKLGVIHV